MSEKCLPEVTYEETPGFKSALFLNLSDPYNCRTPKRKDILDSVESCRLSIESLTPGTTPKGTEKRKQDSNFRFCLSRDLLQRLEESSPFTYYSERKGLASDVCLQGCDDENDAFQKEFTDADLRFSDDSTPSTFLNSDQSRGRDYELQNEEVAKVLSFSDEENKHNFGKILGSVTNPKSGGNNSTDSSVNTSGNIDGVNSLKLNSALNAAPYFPLSKSNKFNKFNAANSFASVNSFVSGLEGKCFNGINGLNLSHISSNGINCINGVSLSNVTNVPNGSPFNNVNMYGKAGWICISCQNFNYESKINLILARVKCNRCSLVKNETFKPTAVVLTQENSANKDDFNGSNSAAKKKKPFVERVGDWNCFKCKNLNFSFRVNCNRCQMSKKESEKLHEEKESS